MPPYFPLVTSPEDFKRIRDDDALREGADAIRRALRLEGGVTRFSDGSLPVFAIGETHVVKLYPPIAETGFRVERHVLGAIEGKIPIPTPKLHADGSLDGWHYLVMQRLPGERLVDVWPRLSPDDRVHLSARLGEGLAALHAVNLPEPSSEEGAMDAFHVDWSKFLREQRARCVERQRSFGLEAPWLEQIPDFLDRVPLDEDPRPVLLHTEIMREHLLVLRAAEGWRLSGVFDFEPSMLGANEYELASVGIFFSCGDAPCLRALLLAYGYRECDLDGALQRRTLAYALLHRYSRMSWYLSRIPPLPGVGTLDALAEQWWGVNV